MMLSGYKDSAFTSLVCQAGDDNNTTWSRLLQQVEETVGEEEMTQVVDTKLHFKAVLRLPLWTHIDTSKKTKTHAG